MSSWPSSPAAAISAPVTPAEANWPLQSDLLMWRFSA